MTGRLLAGTAATKGSTPSPLRPLRAFLTYLPVHPKVFGGFVLDSQAQSCPRHSRVCRPGTSPSCMGGVHPPPWVPPTRARAPASGIPGCSGGGGKPRLQVLATPHSPPQPRPFLLRWKSYLPDPVQVPCFSHPSLAPPLGRR